MEMIQPTNHRKPLLLPVRPPVNSETTTLRIQMARTHHQNSGRLARPEKLVMLFRLCEIA